MCLHTHTRADVAKAWRCNVLRGTSNLEILRPRASVIPFHCLVDNVTQPAISGGNRAPANECSKSVNMDNNKSRSSTGDAKHDLASAPALNGARSPPVSTGPMKGGATPGASAPTAAKPAAGQQLKSRVSDGKAAQEVKDHAAALSTPKDINTIVTAVAASKLGLTEQLKAALQTVQDVVHTRDNEGRSCLHYASGAPGFCSFCRFPKCKEIKLNCRFPVEYGRVRHCSNCST